jgi:hypothetical protein
MPSEEKTSAATQGDTDSDWVLSLLPFLVQVDDEVGLELIGYRRGSKGRSRLRA